MPINVNTKWRVCWINVHKWTNPSTGWHLQIRKLLCVWNNTGLWMFPCCLWLRFRGRGKLGLHGVWSRCKWGVRDQCMQHLVGDASKHSHLNPPAAPDILKNSLTVLFLEGEILIFKTTNSISVVSSPSTKWDSDGCNWNLSSLLNSFFIQQQVYPLKIIHIHP